MRMCARSFGLILMGAALSACAPIPSGDVYYRGQTMRAQTVEMGIVNSVRYVQIAGQDSGAGTVGGAALGGIAGSQIGHGGGSVAGAIGGAIIGGVIGNAVERDATRRNGVEITVHLDGGGLIAVVQEAAEEYHPGDRVRVLSDGYITRVTH